LPARAPFVVLALGFIAARLLLPANARAGLSALRFAWSAVELLVIAVAVAQAGRIRRRYRAQRANGAAPIDALETALTPSIGELPSRLLATELTVLGYAFAGWLRSTPSDDARTFSMHRRAHYSTVVGMFVFLIAVETLLLHVLVMHKSHVAAWLLSASSIWCALWLIGAAHSLRLEPLRFADDALVVTGIRWRARVPYDAIVATTAVGLGDGATRKSATTLDATVLRRADVRLRLSRPLEARGLLGRTRRFDELVLTVDRPDELIAALDAARARGGFLHAPGATT
jgi:hypothetical protein